MKEEPSSKVWIVGCLGAAGVIIAAIIGLGAPFAERIADYYFPTYTPEIFQITPTNLNIVTTTPEPVNQPTILDTNPSATPIPTPSVSPPTQPSVSTEVMPIREHFQVVVGDGVFESGTFSDGLAPYSENWLWENKHFNIQRIRPEEYPSGCDVSRYNTNLVWISGSTGMQFSINDEVVGTYNIADDPHGYIFQWSIRMGDKLCALKYKSIGYSIILGPDIYYHYDSYCYRGNCK